MTRVRALCFDLDGTLLDGSGGGEALRRACVDVAAASPGLTAVRVLNANAEVWRDYWPEVEDAWTLGRKEGEVLVLEAWRRTLRACGCRDEALVRLARDSHIAHERRGLRLFDDARALLSRVPAGLPLALITNGASDAQRDKLQVLGITDSFSAVVVSGEVGMSKPDPAVFRTALDLLGLGPAGVWHVGDNLATDVAGANAAGLRSVWVNRTGDPRGGGRPAPHLEVRSLLDLPILVDRDG